MSVVFGSSFFWVYIGERPMGENLRSLPRTATKTVRLLRVAALVATLSGIGWLAFTIANATGDLASVLDPSMLYVFFFETPFGAPSLVRLALLALLAISAASPLSSSVLLSTNTVVGAGLLVSQAWLGHAAEGGVSLHGLMLISFYAFHVVGAAAWVGGLPILAVAIAERRQRGETGIKFLARYSMMTMVVVGLIILSGIGNTLFHSGNDVRALASTSYGEILLGKLVFFAAMLILAAINRFIIMPRLNDQSRSISNMTGWLETSVALETLLSIFVLGAAAVLGVTAPPH